MSSSRFTLVAAAASALLASTLALAQSATPVLDAPYRFTTVDSYDVRGAGSTVTVTGVLQGDEAPTVLTFRYSTSNGTGYENARTFERCERFALLAMNKPGQYLLELRQENNFGNHLGCKLTRL